MDIDAILHRLMRAWNDGDAEAWAAEFTPDAVFVDVLGRIQRGPDVIVAEHRKIFDTIYRGSRVDIRLLDAHPLADGLVLAHTATTLSAPSGPRAGDTDAVQTMVLRDGHVAAFHNTVRTDFADFADDDEDLAAADPMAWRHPVAGEG